jgi:hypothetical protein
MREEFFRSRFIFLIILFFYSLPTLASDSICTDYQVESAAYSINSTRYNRIVSDASLPRNRQISQRDKKNRIEDHIQAIYQSQRIRNSEISIDELATLLADVATCTGNDFSMLAAVVAKESIYCYDRHNRRGGDSGCGQFTTPAITEIKNQLRLPGRQTSGTNEGQRALETLLHNCYTGNGRSVDYFKSVFSQSPSQVRMFLRSGEDIQLDLIATGMYLKLLYGISGFYFDANSRSAGALARYNGGGTRGYASSVNQKAQNVNACGVDESAIMEIESHACSLSNDPAACHMTVPTYEI